LARRRAGRRGLAALAALEGALAAPAGRGQAAQQLGAALARRLLGEHAVPAALRAREAGAARVLVAIPDGGAARLEERAVTLGAERANGWIEIVAGLSAGDRVVLDGTETAGSRATPRETLRPEAP
jgi:hypothetical protein